MFKDYDKYLSTSLKVYIFVLVLVLILKLVGMEYFGINLNNEIILKISHLIRSSKLSNNLFHIIPLTFYMYIAFAIINNDNSKKMKLFCILIFPISYSRLLLTRLRELAKMHDEWASVHSFY